MLQSKMTIGKKFGYTGAFLTVMTIALGTASLLGLSSADKALSSLTDDSLSGVFTCSRVQTSLLQIRGDMWRHMASGDAADMAAQEQDMQRQKDQLKIDMADVRSRSLPTKQN